jgi:hypothetical protein
MLVASCSYKSLVNSVSIVDTCSTQYCLFYHCHSIFHALQTGNTHPEGSLLLYSFIEQVAISSFTPTPDLGPWKCTIRMWDGASCNSLIGLLPASHVESPSNRLSNSTQRGPLYFVPSISEDLHSNNWATFGHDPERLFAEFQAKSKMCGHSCVQLNCKTSMSMHDDTRITWLISVHETVRASIFKSCLE